MPWGTDLDGVAGDNGQLDLLWRQSARATVGTSTAASPRCWGSAHPPWGKITGLAAYAPPPPDLVRHYKAHIRFIGPGFSRVSSRVPARKGDAFWQEIHRYSREEVAAAAQTVLEDAVVEFVRYWVQRESCGRVAVAGGVFANVKLNQRLHSLPESTSSGSSRT